VMWEGIMAVLESPGSDNHRGGRSQNVVAAYFRLYDSEG